MLEIWKNLSLPLLICFSAAALKRTDADATFFFFGENFATVTKVIESIESGRRRRLIQTETSQGPLRIFFPSERDQSDIRRRSEKENIAFYLEFLK